MSTTNPMTRVQLDEIRERLSARGVKNGERDMRAEQSFAREAPQDITNLLAEVERLRARLTVDEDMVERVARELAYMEPDEEWPSNSDLGGGPCGTRDDEYRAGMHEQAREIIAVVFNTQEGS